MKADPISLTNLDADDPVDNSDSERNTGFIVIFRAGKPANFFIPF